MQMIVGFGLVVFDETFGWLGSSALLWCQHFCVESMHLVGIVVECGWWGSFVLMLDVLVSVSVSIL